MCVFMKYRSCLSEGLVSHKMAVEASLPSTSPDYLPFPARDQVIRTEAAMLGHLECLGAVRLHTRHCRTNASILPGGTVVAPVTGRYEISVSLCLY